MYLAPKQAKVGTLGIAPEVVEWINLRRRVRYDGYAGIVRYIDRLLQRQDPVEFVRPDEVCDGRRVISDGFLELVAGASVFVACLDEPRAGHRETAVVDVALGLLDDDLVFHTRRIGYLGYLVEVPPGHARRGAEGEGCRAARGDVCCLDAQQISDVFARPGEQFRHLDVGVVNGGHRRGHLRHGGRTAEHGPIALGVDDGSRSDFRVYVGPCCCHAHSFENYPNHVGSHICACRSTSRLSTVPRCRGDGLAPSGGRDFTDSCEVAHCCGGSSAVAWPLPVSCVSEQGTYTQATRFTGRETHVM